MRQGILDGITEAYEVFEYAFKNDDWTEFVEPMGIWIKQNNK